MDGKWNKRPTLESCGAIRLDRKLHDKCYPSDIEEMILKRHNYRKQKKFKEADAIRVDLNNCGIFLEEGSKEVRWYIDKAIVPPVQSL